MKGWCIIEGRFVIEKTPKERRTAIRKNDGQSIHLKIFQVNNAPRKLLAARRSSFKGTVDRWVLQVPSSAALFLLFWNPLDRNVSSIISYSL
jgi:hypothetical protein